MPTDRGSRASCFIPRPSKVTDSVPFAAALRPALVTRRLGEQLVERSSAVAWLRLIAATAVVLFHCFALNRQWARDPLALLLPGTDLGLMGVQIFFFLSGLLVAQSYARHRTLVKFALARVLRLYPALIAAAFFTVAVAAWSSTLDIHSFLFDRATLTYLWRCALGLVVSDMLPSAFSHNPFPFATNGSLWTLPIEIKLYFCIAAVGLLGTLNRRWIFTIVVGACIALFVLYPATFPIAPDFRGTRIITLMFALGALSFVWRDYVPLSLLAALSCLALLGLIPVARTEPVIYSLLVAYPILTMGYHPLLQNALPPLFADLSYGIYVYSFPIQQTLIERWIAQFAGNPWLLFPVAMSLILPIAALSWFALEKPALKLKLT
jgi:peptidoglycan/LPS O-acetylase OafA/YrhL